MKPAYDFQADPLSTWLVDHQDLIRFIQVDSPTNPESPTETQDSIMNCLNRLTTFFNYRLSESRPEKPILPKHVQSDSQSSSFAVHQHFFIQGEMYRFQERRHESSIVLCRGLIDTLMKTLDTNSFVVKIAFEQLFMFLLSDPPEIQSLKIKDLAIVSEVSQNVMILPDAATSESELALILYAMRIHYDRKTFFLPPHPLQSKFEQLLFHPSFVLHDDVQLLINSGNQFSVSCLSLLEQIIRTFRLSDSVDLSIISVIFFRAVFDWAYENRPQMFQQRPESKIRQNYARYRVPDTGASPKYLPQGIEDSERLCDIIAKDELLEASGRELATAAFYNSPLDVLYCVHCALTHIRKFVARIDSEMVQSFDTVFGLFLVVLLGCDLPNPEDIFTLIENYAPMNGLSGPLEYARSTISASSLQCAAILKNLGLE
jgi:hypothetical protein